MLRLYDLTDDLNRNPQELLQELQTIIDREPSADKIYAFAELSYLAAKHKEGRDPKLAIDLYSGSVLHAYQYLFDERFSDGRNPFDPQFRGACDLYNGALESALRLVCKQGDLKPGVVRTINTASGSWDITCTLRNGRWRMEDFDHFEFVSDYKINGLRNHYHTYGLGVPLIAVRRNYEGEPAAARYYPENLSFPVTAFVRPTGQVFRQSEQSAGRQQAVLELYDPLTTDRIVLGDRQIRLESDTTTPLAYFLSDPKLGSLATVGLLRPDVLLNTMRPGGKKPVMGIYAIQPYEPGKIPVLLVHGLWSSPMTWMEMFNDLRSSPEICRQYQFWFYLYPTGQPFLISAAQLRRDLAEVRAVLDPEKREPALDQMVLIGHSMGGLVSRLQTVQSREDYWKMVSDKPFAEVKADPDALAKLQSCFFFEPNPSIRRVITIGTPHRGSDASNDMTRWLTGKLIQLPRIMTNNRQGLFRDNKDIFRDISVMETHTSIESLAPSSPLFPVMLASYRPPWVRYHNIVGMAPKTGLLRKVAGGDGVVGFESAHMEDVESEIVVTANHTTVHSHPRTVLEVRRILLEHLTELRGLPGAQPAQVRTALAPQGR